MYDITRNTDRSSASAALTNINSAGRWLALGGVYHGGIQVPGLAPSLLGSARSHSRSAMQCGWGPGVWRGVVLRLHGDSWHWRLLLHAKAEPNVRGDRCSRSLERGLSIRPSGTLMPRRRVCRYTFRESVSLGKTRLSPSEARNFARGR